MIRVKPSSLAQVSHPAYAEALPNSLPYSHQAELYDAWDQHNALLLTTPTGSGKTQAAAFPIVRRGEAAVFVYPTNALARDQARSIHLLLDRMAMPYYDLDADSEWDLSAYRRAGTVVARVESETLEEFRRSWHRRHKGQALAELLSHQEKPLLLLTNPDTLFFMLALRYHSGFEILGRLQGFGTLVIDEFHIYGGVELAALLFMVHCLLKMEGFFRRVVFLSATPQQEVLDLLNRLFSPRVIHSTIVPESCRPSRRVLWSVQLEVEPVSSVVEHIADRICVLRDQGRLITSNNGRLPVVVILNSVIAAIYLEDLLVQRGFSQSQLGIYRGLSHHTIRDVGGKVVVVGTSAIEVGVDFDGDHLLFDASSGQSFLQRFGRIGRHRDGAAVLYAPGHVVEQARCLEPEIARAELSARAFQWFGEFDARPWFTSTGKGLLLAAAMLERYGAVARDTELSRRLAEHRDRLIMDFALRVGAPRQLLSQIRHLMKRNPQWLASYRNAQNFRASGLSVLVYDNREVARRGDKAFGWYQADIRVLLERALRPEWRGDHLAIRGYGARQRVTAESGFEDNRYGEFAAASQVRPYFLVNGDRHPLSDFAQLAEHIVVKLPPAIEPHLDWRIDHYPTPGGYLLFDGNALLGQEIANRFGLLS